MADQPAPVENTNVTPEAAAPAPALPSVPDQWPGGFGAYKYSKAAVMRNLSNLIVLWVISIVISILVQMVFKKQIGQVITNVLDIWFTLAGIYVYLHSVRGQQAPYMDSLKETLPLFLKGVLLNILVALSIVVGLVLLIVPGLIIACRLSLTNYFLVDKNLGVMEAYKASMEATKGHVGKVLGIAGAAIAMALLVITIIGIPFSIYFLIMYSAVLAVFYEFLGKKSPTNVAPVAAAPEV